MKCSYAVIIIIFFIGGHSTFFDDKNDFSGISGVFEVRNFKQSFTLMFLQFYNSYNTNDDIFFQMESKLQSFSVKVVKFWIIFKSVYTLEISSIFSV